MVGAGLRGNKKTRNNKMFDAAELIYFLPSSSGISATEKIHQQLSRSSRRNIQSIFEKAKQATKIRQIVQLQQNIY